MLSKKTASKIGYDLGINHSNTEPLARSSRGSLEIFGGGRSSVQTAAILNNYSGYQRRPDTSSAQHSTARGEQEHVAERSSDRRDAQPHAEQDSGSSNPGRARSVGKQRDQVSRWLADVSGDAVSGSRNRSSRSPSPLPPRVLGNENCGGENLSLVDDLDIELLSRLRISECRDRKEHVKLSELLGGTFKPVEEELEARYGNHSNIQNRSSKQGAAAGGPAMPEVSSEREEVLEGKGESKGGPGPVHGVGSGRPPSGPSHQAQANAGRQTRQTGASPAAVLDEDLHQGKAGNGIARETTTRMRGTISPEKFPTSPESEATLQRQQQGGAGCGAALQRNSSRRGRPPSSSEISPDDHEWERLMQVKGVSTGVGRETDSVRNIRTSETSAVSPEWKGILQSAQLQGEGASNFVKCQANSSSRRESRSGRESTTLSRRTSAASDASEWEGILQAQEAVAGRHSSTLSRRTSDVSDVPPEWEEILQAQQGGAGNGELTNGGSRRNSITMSRTSFTSDTAELPPEWEEILQAKQRGGPGSDGGALPTNPSRQSRTSTTSETSPEEWDRVLAAGAAPHGRPSRHSRQSRQSVQSNCSATSAMSYDSVISERGAQWGYEVKLHANSNVDERLSGSSWLSSTSVSNGSKSSWTTSEASSGGSSNYAHAVIPGVSKNIKDALASFQLAFVVCDAVDPNYPVLYASAGFFSMTGYSTSEVVGKNCRFLQGEFTDAADIAKIRDALSEGKIYTGKILNYKKDASPFWNLLTISPIKDDNGKLIKWIGMLAEVTENGSSQEEKLRAEVQTRIEKETKRYKTVAGLPTSGGGCSLTLLNKGVEVSTQTSFAVEDGDRRGSKSSESQRRTSYSLTNQSSRYSSASSHLTPDPSLDLPEWQASGKLRDDIAVLSKEVQASNTSRLKLELPSAKSKSSFKLGKLFKKLKGGISTLSSSSKSKSGSGAAVEAPYEFSESDGSEDLEPDTTDPRVAAELARKEKQQRRSGNNFLRPSTAEETRPTRRHSSNTYSTSNNLNGEMQRGTGSAAYSNSMGVGSDKRNGVKDMGQFCIVHS